MPKVQAPQTELLDGYGDVIEACRSLAQIGDQYWNNIYLPLISSTADYFSGCSPTGPENTSCSQPPSNAAHKSLELCVAANIKTRPKLTMFAAFSASLCQDVGQPAGDLEVTAMNRGRRINSLAAGRR